jgi:hypothetical protein
VKSTSRQRRPSSSPWRSPGHRRREVERTFDATERVVGVVGCEERFQLHRLEELQLCLGLPHDRSVGQLDRVLAAPAATLAELEDGMQRSEVVADRLDRKRFPFGGDVPLDIGRRDSVGGFAAEERREVVAEIRCDRQPVGLLAASELEAA